MLAAAYRESVEVQGRGGCRNNSLQGHGRSKRTASQIQRWQWGTSSDKRSMPTVAGALLGQERARAGSETRSSVMG